MSIFYFPLGDFLGEGNYTFKESALTNRAANLSKNKIQYLESQNSHNQTEMSGSWPDICVMLESVSHHRESSLTNFSR